MATNSLEKMSKEHEAQIQQLSEMGLDVAVVNPDKFDVSGGLDQLIKLAVASGYYKENATTKTLNAVCRVVESEQIPLGLWGKKFNGYRVGYKLDEEGVPEFSICLTSVRDNPDTPYLRSWIASAQVQDEMSPFGFQGRITDLLMLVYRRKCLEVRVSQLLTDKAIVNESEQVKFMDGFATTIVLSSRADKPLVSGYRYPRA